MECLGKTQQKGADETAACAPDATKTEVTPPTDPSEAVAAHVGPSCSTVMAMFGADQPNTTRPAGEEAPVDANATSASDTAGAPPPAPVDAATVQEKETEKAAASKPTPFTDPRDVDPLNMDKLLDILSKAGSIAPSDSTVQSRSVSTTTTTTSDDSGPVNKSSDGSSVGNPLAGVPGEPGVHAPTDVKGPVQSGDGRDVCCSFAKQCVPVVPTPVTTPAPVPKPRIKSSRIGGWVRRIVGADALYSASMALLVFVLCALMGVTIALAVQAHTLAYQTEQSTLSAEVRLLRCDCMASATAAALHPNNTTAAAASEPIVGTEKDTVVWDVWSILLWFQPAHIRTSASAPTVAKCTCMCDATSEPIEGVSAFDPTTGEHTCACPCAGPDPLAVQVVDTGKVFLNRLFFVAVVLLVAVVVDWIVFRLGHLIALCARPLRRASPL